MILKVRKGVSLPEMLVCLVLFSSLMVTVITVMSRSVMYTSNAQRVYSNDLDIETVLDSFQTDIKSASRTDIQDTDHLAVFTADALIEYYVDDGVFYRNNEIMMHNVTTCTFTSENEYGVRLYLVLTDGTTVDLYVRR